MPHDTSTAAASDGADNNNPFGSSQPVTENGESLEEVKISKVDTEITNAATPQIHDRRPDFGVGHPPPSIASRVKTHTYHIPATSALALKLAASTPTHPVSTHDALSALMWRTLMHARHASGALSHPSPKTNTPPTESTYTLPHNARRHVGLPSAWVGNACYFISATLPISTILSPSNQSLPIMAESIRAALNAVDGDIVGGLMHLRKECTYDVT